MTKVRVTTAKRTYWVKEDEIDAIDDDSAAEGEIPAGDEQDVEAHDADHEGGLFAWLGDKFQTSPHVAEWVVGVLVASSPSPSRPTWRGTCGSPATSGSTWPTAARSTSAT